MKRFFSFLCAVALVLSTTAAPQIKSFKPAAQLNKLTTVKVEKQSARKSIAPFKMLDKKQLKAQAPRKNPKTVALKKLLKTERVADVKRPVRRAHKADVSFEIKAENITHTTADVTVTPSDNEASYYFDLFAASDAKDMSDAEVVAALQENWEEQAEDWGIEVSELLPYILSEGEDSYSFKNLQAGTEYTVVAFLVDEEGNLVGEVTRFSFITEGAVAPTGEKVNLGELTLDYFDDYRDMDGSFILYLANDTTEVALCIFDDDLVGTFTIEDMDLDWSYIYFENLGKPGIQSVSISAVLSDDGKSSKFTVALIANNGIEYDFTAVVELEEGGGEEPVDPIDGTISISVSDITKSGVSVAVTPSVEGATFYWNVFAASDVAGLSDAEIGALFVQEMNEIIEAYAEWFDLTFEDLLSDGEDSYEFSGLTASTDYVVLAAYMDANANLQSEVFKGEFRTLDPPVAQDTIYHTFVEPVEINAFEDGDFYFYTKGDDDYILTMDWYSNVIAGEFKLADLYTDYCGLRAIVDGDTTRIAFDDIALKIEENETNFAITVTYLGSDGHCYILSATSNKAVADRTEQVSLENAHYESLGADASYYGFSHYVLAAPADSSLVIALAVVPESFVGSFTEADLFAAYCGVLDEDGYFQIAEAEFTVSAGENNSFTLEGWLLANNNVKYEFVIKTAEIIPQFTFELTESSIIIKPANNDELWDWYSATPDIYEYYGADRIASIMYSNNGTKYAVSGEYELTFEELYQSGFEAGEQVLVVWACDEEGVTSAAVSFEFTLPEKQYASDMTFDIQQTEEGVVITPSNNNELWAYYIMDLNTYNDYCGNNPDYVATVIYGNQGTQYAQTGSYTITLDELEEWGVSGSSWVLVAWGCDENEVTTKAAEFIYEKPVVPSDMTFEFEETEGVVKVVPSNDEDPWDITLMTAEEFEEEYAKNADAVAAEYYSQYGDEDAAPGAREFDLAELELEDGSYVIIVWGADGGVTTPAASYAFTIGGEDPTALEDIDAAAKANKVLRNGHLFIEKGSARFNANGIRVK